MRVLRFVRFPSLAVACILLLTRIGTTAAQGTFSTLYQECASCCSKDGDIEDAIFSCDGPGPDSIGYESLDCGTAAPGGCGVECGSSNVMVPQPDPSCESCSEGPHNPCYTDEDCCGGMYCDGANPPATGTCQYD